MHVVTIKENRGHTCEKEVRGAYGECFRGGNGR